MPLLVKVLDRLHQNFECKGQCTVWFAWCHAWMQYLPIVSKRNQKYMSSATMPSKRCRFLSKRNSALSAACRTELNRIVIYEVQVLPTDTATRPFINDILLIPSKILNFSGEIGQVWHCYYAQPKRKMPLKLNIWQQLMKNSLLTLTLLMDSTQCRQQLWILPETV